MRINNLILILFLLCTNIIVGQQLAQYTQWASHQFAFNPAHAGIKNCLELHSLYRTQWLGFQGAPKNGFLTLSAPINSLRKHALSAIQGIGAKIEFYNIGPISTNRLNLAYSSHFNFTPEDRLSIGMYLGVVQFSYDVQNLSTIQPDPSISQDVTFINPDASIGAWWNSTNYYLGLSIQNIITSKWNNIGNDSRFQMHTTLNGGARISLNKYYTIIPSFLLKIPPAGLPSIDLNALFNYNNQAGFGFGIRNTNALLFLVNVKINGQFSINYSFDYPLNDLRPGTFSTHELSFIFSTCKQRQIGSTKCPLFE